MLANKVMGATSAAPDLNYIEDVFSTYLYTGNDTAQTINNGVDLAGKGGLVWIKSRSSAVNHTLWDTNRGVRKFLSSNNTDADFDFSGTSYGLSAFNANGFALGLSANGENSNGSSLCSWTFRKQPKFFDVVTYTGNGANRTISHNLDSALGAILVKRTDTTGNWQLYHRGLTSAAYSVLFNTTDAQALAPTVWNSTAPTSTVFSIGTDATVNASGGTYVAYLFAHDAGGFGLSGEDNVISCGSYTGNGSATGPVVTLGYEPQWLLVRKVSAGGVATIQDTMRGLGVSGSKTAYLLPSLANAEDATTAFLGVNATGFQVATDDSYYNSSGATYIYVAIRRGPMKVPTDGTKVYNAIARTGTGAAATVTGVGFAPDLVISKTRAVTNWGPALRDRLRGGSRLVQSDLSEAETTLGISETVSFNMDGIGVDSDDGSPKSSTINWNGWTYINWFFRRAPGFFDEVCYTGTGGVRTVAHNLAAVPELMIVKCRSDAAFWTVYSAGTGAGSYSVLNTTAAKANDTGAWDNTTPTSSVFTLGNSWVQLNQSAATYVAYLFATCPGVSKVGSYTGTGTTQAINCGFTTGARFVLIKRTDDVGAWYVWDSARGIVAGNDPHLSLNSTAAEVTGTDYIDPSSAGFEISSTAPAAINASGGSYIFLAVA